ncbi:hypothetical protein HMPREF2767_08235 [Nosocomiicoccus sp. HMSC067E10]|uniref:restriction endonuclease subunit S n=1 Tax=Nosocomiicoccus sp. HMSC067E10 TaxID=1739271 RepID=UPI0008C0C7AB|nr:restriction endonuclease subunit S [Nosocomiicoccus sp. HMSC067E10]OFL48253.1 hypothetical protein HMPREF2767_08235 [Nosocomiicoccus sp. HMSC067E10]
MMKKQGKQRLVPKLRFKGFSEDWEQCKLKEIGKDYSGLSGKTKKDFGHGESLYVPYKNIFNNHIVDVNNLEKVNVESKQNKVSYGDIFFTISSEIPEEVGMSSVMGEDIENLYLNSFSFGLRPHKETGLDVIFSSYLFRTPTFRKKMYILAQGISRYNISKTNVMRLVVELPSFNEQKKIGEILYKLESMITLHKRKMQVLKDQKNLYLNKMFISQQGDIQLRFKGFTEPWEQEKLGVMCDFKVGGDVDKVKLLENGKYPVIANGKENDGIIGYYSDYRFSEGKVTVSGRGDVGYAKLRERPFTPVVRLIVISSSVIQGKFLELLINNLKIYNESTGVPQLTAPQLSTYYVSFPSQEEQLKISNMILYYEKLITLHNKKLNKLESLKNEYLNYLFI